jgi:hypothetical protein
VQTLAPVFAATKWKGVAIRDDIPPVAHTLGYAGLLPQAAALLCLAGRGMDYRFSALAFAFAYGALILSFLGALWWGLAAAQPERAPKWVWPVGVLPCLVALGTCVPWAIGADWPKPSLLVLALAIAATPLVDRRLARLELCPPGWLRLRVRLSTGLAILTALCALA